MWRAIERGAEVGCDAIQIFAGSSRQWRLRALPATEVRRWQRARRDLGVATVLAHGSYLVNLAALSAALRERSRGALAREYRRCARLGIPNLVFHPGAHMGAGVDVGIARIAGAIDRILVDQPDNPTRLVLENTAGQGSSIGHDFAELGAIFAAVAEPERLGVCLDTCHAYAAGYDLSSSAGFERTMAAFEAAVGCRRLVAMHINDSKGELGSRVDRHQHLGRGELGLRGFLHVVNDSRLVGLPMVLETPKPAVHADAINLAILRALAGRQRVGKRARQLAEQPFDEAPPA